MNYRYTSNGFAEVYGNGCPGNGCPGNSDYAADRVRGIAMQLSPRAVPPRRANPSDAGADLHLYLGPEDSVQRSFISLAPGEQALLDTGVAVKIPEGFAGFVMARSSMRLKSITAWGDGLIDAAYRGTIKVVVSNQGNETYVINNGDRIGQLVIQKVELVEFVDIWNDTERGTGGFGSTGK